MLNITWKTGEVFAATWKKDRIQNEATIKFTNGDEFVCEFKNGLPTGEGQYLFPDGEIIEGDIEMIEMMLIKEEVSVASALEPNLGFASYALALEYKTIEEYDLATHNFKQAEAYLPHNSGLIEQIPHQMASLEEIKRN